MNLFALLFGCNHKRLSFPQTHHGRTHVCCLECGREFAYDWSSMQIVRPAKCEAGTVEEVVA